VARAKRAKLGPRGAIGDASRVAHQYGEQAGTRGPAANAGRVVHAAGGGGDPAIAALATRQHGVVTTAQLHACGLGRSAIARRVGRGHLHRLHRGVYLVGHRAPSSLGREIAAVLACGEGALLSHQAAASVWGIRPATSGPVDVTVTARGVQGRPGVRVHHARRLDPRDVRRRFGIPLTAPARTVLDLAPELDQGALERMLAEAQLRHLLATAELESVLDRHPRRPGAGALRRLLEGDGAPALTRSEAEERLLALLRAAELPPTAVNARIGRHEVDLLFEPERLVVEMDGFAYHRTRSAFERDRLRDAELQAAGYRVVRVTWRQLVERPEALVARLAQALARA
jgi:very-short-patch-repair endonuclease